MTFIIYFLGCISLAGIAGEVWLWMCKKANKTKEKYHEVAQKER